MAIEGTSKKMAIEGPSFSLGIESDSEDLLNRIVEDSVEKDGEAGHVQDVESEVNSHHHVEGGERNFKHNFDLNEVPNEDEGAVEVDDINEVPNQSEGAAEGDLDLNKLPNDMLNVENEIEEDVANHDNEIEEELANHDNEEDGIHKNEELKKGVDDMLKIYINGLP